MCPNLCVTNSTCIFASNWLVLLLFFFVCGSMLYLKCPNKSLMVCCDWCNKDTPWWQLFAFDRQGGLVGEPTASATPSEGKRGHRQAWTEASPSSAGSWVTAGEQGTTCSAKTNPSGREKQVLCPPCSLHPTQYFTSCPNLPLRPSWQEFRQLREGGVDLCWPQQLSLLHLQQLYIFMFSYSEQKWEKRWIFWQQVLGVLETEIWKTQINQDYYERMCCFLHFCLLTWKTELHWFSYSWSLSSEPWNTWVSNWTPEGSHISILICLTGFLFNEGSKFVISI